MGLASSGGEIGTRWAVEPEGAPAVPRHVAPHEISDLPYDGRPLGNGHERREGRGSRDSPSTRVLRRSAGSVLEQHFSVALHKPIRYYRIVPSFEFLWGFGESAGRQSCCEATFVWVGRERMGRRPSSFSWVLLLVAALSACAEDRLIYDMGAGDTGFASPDASGAADDTWGAWPETAAGGTRVATREPEPVAWGAVLEPGLPVGLPRPSPSEEGTADTSEADEVVPSPREDDGDVTPEGGAGNEPDAASGPSQVLDVEVEERIAPGDGGWAFVERCYVRHHVLRLERFIAKTRHVDSGVVGAFGGDAAPPAERFLLHAAPGWETARGRPVLLVHGTGSHATQSFAEPDPLGRQPGLAPFLAGEGLPVFAVTFPARFGDNLNQAVELAAALQLVRERTGATVVDLVAHSKGGLAALAYVADLLADRGLPYQDDVGRLLLLGAPLGGMDYSFRHPSFNYAAAVWGFELPTSWDQMLLWGLWQDVTDESIYGGAYDGLLQASSRWDDVHGLSLLEQDWYTTYEGGYGFVSHSLGIDAAIEMGDHFIARLRGARLPSELSVGLLIGTSAWVGLVPWETAGPSDGLIFAASAGDGAWVQEAGARLADVCELRVNHWELVYDERAREWVLANL